MKKLFISLLVLGLLVAGFSAVGAAFGGFGGYRQESSRTDFDRPALYCQEELGIDEEQLTEMNDLQDEFFTERDQLREQLQESVRKLRELQFAEASDEEIANLRSKINNLQSEMNNLQYNHREKMKEVLTPEQLEKMNEYGFGQRDNTGKRHGSGAGRGARSNRGSRGKW